MQFKDFVRAARFLFEPRKPPTVSPPKHITHTNALAYLSAEFDRPGLRILEIGSRVVKSANGGNGFQKASHVGFDYHPGPNVDVVGDAHRLASYFEGQRFDLIFCIAVFEHLYAPWLVAQEIQKLLKVGGCAYVETHFSYIAHDRPWNFFQFSDHGLRALFNPALGFEVIDAGMSNPIRGYFTKSADPYLRFKKVEGLYCHSSIFCRKVAEVQGFAWENCAAGDLVGQSSYPEISD